jgi:hypothetical protein
MKTHFIIKRFLLALPHIVNGAFRCNTIPSDTSTGKTTFAKAPKSQEASKAKPNKKRLIIKCVFIYFSLYFSLIFHCNKNRERLLIRMSDRIPSLHLWLHFIFYCNKKHMYMLHHLYNKGINVHIHCLF